MEEMFRLEIEGDRKTTVPQHLLNLLRLREGDEIRIIAEDSRILRVEPHQNRQVRKKTAEEKSDLKARIELVRAGVHDDEDRLSQQLEVAIGAGL